MAEPTYKIDPRSDTWKAVLEWARAEREDALQMLIEDCRSERQRGRIESMDALLNLARPPEVPTVTSDTYT